MKSGIFTTTLAAALALGCAGASALTVSIDFEALGRQAVALDEPVPATNVSGLKFSGGYVYAVEMLNSDDFQPGSGNASSGFLMNRSRNPQEMPNDIVITLADEAVAASKGAASAAVPSLADLVFRQLTFLMFTSGGGVTWAAYNENDVQVGDGELNAGSGNKSWTSADIELPAASGVTRLVLFAGGSTIGLDGMTVDLQDPGGNGNVPEPASWALVGCALLAAGNASRKRR